jgi:uncharacterized protein DUF4231
MSRRRNGYVDSLRREFVSIIDSLDLEEERKRYLKLRWLDQVVWVEKKAVESQRRYYALRLTTIVGALVIPALVSVTPANDSLARTVRIGVWVVSLVVAISAAVEQFFRFGERWRNYRQTAERLKTEGWLFFQLSGPYGGDGTTHDAAFTAFASRVEAWIKSDVDVYLTEIAVEREKQRGTSGASGATTAAGE